jgi:diguanylate cyclase (GGDEF)-like protein
MNAWRQRLASVLDWSATDKGFIPAIFLVLTNLQYLAWGQYALHHPDSNRLIHTDVMHELFQLVAIMTAGALVLIGLGIAIRRRLPDFTPFQLATTLYFAVTLVISSYYIGTMTLAAGVVLLGGPVFGFIVLDRRVVWVAFIAALSLLMALGIMTSSGQMPYAPVMKPPVDVESQMFWHASGWLFAAPHVVFIVILADLTLNWWRKREDVIRQMSRTDALTGIHNRRSIIEMLEKETARTHRHGPPLCVVLLDLDHFKKINDTWGHPMGDQVLKETANLLRQTIRQCDAVGRYGGEEFMILLPDTDLKGAEAVVERCRAQLAAMELTNDAGERVPVSGSFGLVCNEHYLAASAEILIKQADDALYRAKEGGRNRVVALDVHALA